METKHKEVACGDEGFCKDHENLYPLHQVRKNN